MKTEAELKNALRILRLHLEAIKKHDDGSMGHGLLKLKTTSKIKLLEWILDGGSEITLIKL